MILFKIGKAEDPKKWHKTFAWRPIWANDISKNYDYNKTLVWLITVWQRLDTGPYKPRMIKKNKKISSKP